MGRIFTSLADEHFNRLFTDFRFTAFRLETLQQYAVSYEEDEFERFLAGERRGSFPGISEWADTVSNAVAVGKRVHRVHVVEEPLSDYVRFECAWAYSHTVAAGENVRVLPVPRGSWPELPRSDYWLFDSSHLVTMHYDGAGSFRAAEVVDDHRAVVKANFWRDQAVNLSMSYEDFASRYDDQLMPHPAQ